MLRNPLSPYEVTRLRHALLRIGTMATESSVVDECIQWEERLALVTSGSEEPVEVVDPYKPGLLINAAVMDRLGLSGGDPVRAAQTARAWAGAFLAHDNKIQIAAINCEKPLDTSVQRCA